MAGRAGRGEKPGRVIIQTYKTDDETIQDAAKQDYRAFFEREFARRRHGLYPPFTIMARLLVEAEDEAIAQRVSGQLYERCEQTLAAHPVWKKRTLMLMHDRPSIKVLRGKARYHVLMKLLVHPDTEPWCAVLSDMARDEFAGADVYFEYNPTAMI